MERNKVSLLVLLLSIVAAVIFYSIIFIMVDDVWGTVMGWVWLSLVTFCLSWGIYISARIRAKNTD